MMRSPTWLVWADIVHHEPELLPAHSVECRIAKHLCQGQKLCNVRVSDRAVHTWDIPEVFGSTSERERIVLNAVLRIRRRERSAVLGMPILFS